MFAGFGVCATVDVCEQLYNAVCVLLFVLLGSFCRHAVDEDEGSGLEAVEIF